MFSILLLTIVSLCQGLFSQENNNDVPPSYLLSANPLKNQAYDQCVSGKVYYAGDFCTMGAGSTCTIWKAQWWINTDPSKGDQAWKKIGACESSSDNPNTSMDKCVSGKVYYAGDLCAMGAGSTCIIWKAQWWVNTDPSNGDPAWKRIGACDGSQLPNNEKNSPKPQPPTPQPNPGDSNIIDMNSMLEKLVENIPKRPDTTKSGIGSWLTDIKSSISNENYERLLDVAYYVRTLPIDLVTKIQPNKFDNPSNVKRVERIVSESKWYNLFPMTNSQTKEGNPEGIGIYTYQNFLKAIGSFPAYCGDYNNHPKLRNVDADEICRKLLATTFAHFNKETSSNAPNWNTPLTKQGLYWIKEVGCTNGKCGQYTMGADLYPANLQTGNTYFGRGCKQLSHPANYATYSILLFGKPDILLQYPDFVSTTWLAFGSGIYFAVTPVSSKPAMIEIMDGNYVPNDNDKSFNFIPGFGLTTHIINGGIECMPNYLPVDNNGVPFWQVRANYYKYFAKELQVNEPINEATLSCNKMKNLFTTNSASSRPYYFNPPGCELVRYETRLIAYGGKSTLCK